MTQAPLTLSERLLHQKPTRVCPECGNDQLQLDEALGELVCAGARGCGLVVKEDPLPVRDIPEESQTHAATNPLHFSGAKGTDMNKRVFFHLYRTGQLGTMGMTDMGIRQRQLSQVLNSSSNGNGLQALEHRLKEDGSQLLESCGFKNTPVSKNQESRLSHIIGNDLGTMIHRYCTFLEPLEATGAMSHITVQTPKLLHSMLALWVGRQANESQDKRRLKRVLPKLTAVDEKTMKFLSQVV